MSLKSETNRANAQYSTGPKTEEGKKRSSKNALRHGLTSNDVTLMNEKQEDYEAHLQSFLDEYHPQGATESHLVKMLADTAWRQIRVSVFEADLMVFSPTAFDEFEMQHKALANLSIHGQRLARQFERTMKELHDLQKIRKANEKTESGFVFTEPPSPAKIEPIPTPAGFVFATAAPNTGADRDRASTTSVEVP